MSAPCVVVAGTHSGVGKTTVATGVMAALRATGLRVGGAKVGPDYIDPGYHELAIGRPSRNLDPWMCGEAAIGAVADRAGEGCDVVVVEGVMGLFDGAAAGPSHPQAGEPDWPVMRASTAHVARLLGAPVVLVVDASGLSGSVAALVHGYAHLDPGVSVAGVVLNRVGSPSHEAMLRAALAPLAIPVVGALPRDPALRWRDRHLGLVPVVEQRAAAEQALARLAALVGRHCDLGLIRRIADGASRRQTATTDIGLRGDARVPIAVAAGPSFSFTYPDNLEALEAAGAELVAFDPLEDQVLPPGARGLVAGGGFPEVFAEQLAHNRPLLEDVRRAVSGGLVTWAECGGLLWLARRLDGVAMAGAVECDAVMTTGLTLGYREAVATVVTPLGPAGTRMRGHEFHYSTVEPNGEALTMTGRTGTASAGFASPTLLASYLHQHLAGHQELADAFVQACAAAPPAGQPDGSA